VFASPQGSKSIRVDTSSRSSAYRFPSIESESSSTTGCIPQKRSPKPTNRCSNSWRNPTVRTSEGLVGGEAHQTFEMATTCKGQCIIDEERIDSKESRLMNLEIAFASHCKVMSSAKAIRIRIRHSYHAAIFLLTPLFLILEVHKHTRIQ